MQIGSILFQKATIECPGCGHAMQNLGHMGSVFMILVCHESDCRYQDCAVLIEKATMQVILQLGWQMWNDEAVWPSHWVNRKGEQVLPKPGQITGG